MAENILLTGLPRSGTTLACDLLNQMPDTIALPEPMIVATLSRKTVANDVEHFAARQRESLLERGRAVCKHVDGRRTDNYFGAEQNYDGLRQSRATRGEIGFDKILDPNFTLVIKHPAAFTALLEPLARNFPCYAVIRNPLSVLASWNSTHTTFREGRSPAAERLDLALTKKLQALDSRLERQIALICWFFDQYLLYLPQERIIRYEQIIESRGADLSVITPRAAALDEVLQNRNSSSVYDWATLGSVYERLLASEGAHWNFYSRDDVREVYSAAVGSTSSLQHDTPQANLNLDGSNW